MKSLFGTSKKASWFYEANNKFDKFESWEVIRQAYSDLLNSTITEHNEATEKVVTLVDNVDEDNVNDETKENEDSTTLMD